MGDDPCAWFGVISSTARVVGTAREGEKMLTVGNAQQQTFGGYIDGDGGGAGKNNQTYSTINNGWRRRWRTVGGWRGRAAMTTDDGRGRR